MNFRKFERSPLGGKTINNVHLIKNRRINNGNEIKRYFDLMSEDKASRYKMEETSCSLPGTVKSTILMIFSPDGQRVASTHGDRIYICDLTSGKLVETLQGHPKLWCLAWHPVNKEILASGCQGGEVRVWDLRSKACATWSNEPQYDIASLAFHPTDRILVIATSNELHFWDWSQAKPYATSATTFEQEKVRFVRFDTSGTKLITGISILPKIINHNSESLQTGSYQDRVFHGGPYQYNIQSSSSHNYARRMPNDNEPQTEQTGTTVSSNFDEQLAQRRDTSVLLRLKLLYQQLERLEESPRHTCSNEAMSRLDVLDIIGSSSQYEATASHHPSHKKPMDIKSEKNAIQPPTTSGIQCDQGTQTASTLFNLAHLNKGKWSFLRVTSQDVNMDPFRRENLIRLIQQSNSVDALAKVFEGSLQQLASSYVPYSNDMPNTDTQPSTSHQATPTSDSRSRSIDNQHPLFQLDPCRRRHGRILASLKLYRQTAYRVALSSMNPLQSSQPITLTPPDEIITNPNVMAFGGTTGLSNIPDRLRQRIPAEIMADVRGLSTVDPILSIQFRNTGRNVPLSSSCRLDLLCARLTIIMHSQKLLEQMMGTSGHQFPNPIGVHMDEEDSAARNSSSLFFLLNQLYKTLQNINYSDLVVATAREFVEKSRRRIDRILERLIRISSRFTDVGHIRQQIYFVARHLTSRDSDNPAAESMDDLRLDLIHCLCIVDLTLHFTRQVQFMQVCETRSSNREHAVAGSHTSRDNILLSPDTVSTSNPTRLNTRSVNQTNSLESLSAGISESDSSDGRKNNHSKRKLESEASPSLNNKRKRKAINDDGVSKDNLNASIKSSLESKASTSSVSTRSMTKAARQTDDKPKSSDDNLSQQQVLVPNTSQTQSRPSTSTVGHLSCVPSGSRIGIQISSQLPAVVRFVNNLGNFNLEHGPDDGVDPYINHTIRPIGAYISGGMAERLSSSGARNTSAQNGMVHIVVGVFSPNNNQSGTSAEQLTASQVQSRAILNNQVSGIRLIDRSVQDLQEESEFIIDSGLADVMRVSNPGDILAPNYQPNSNVALQIIQARQRRLMPDVENVIVRDGNMIAVQGAIIYSQPQQQQNEVNSSSHGGARLLGNHVRSDSRPFSRGNLFGNGSGYHINANLNHLWWNSWGIAFSNQTHFRIQCWDFSHSKLPDIKDSSANVVTSKSRIYNDASIDISSDGQLLACLEPQADAICTPPIDFKIYSLNSKDFATCYYRWSCGPTIRSVSISPLGGYVVVGLTCQKSSFVSDISSDTMVIARVLKLNGPNSLEHVRDISINRNVMSLNLIKWLPRSGQGLIYGTSRGQLIIARPVSDQHNYVDIKNVDFQP